MKKVFLMLALLVCISANAQYRDVKLPKAPQKSNYKNYETEESGFWCAAEFEGGSSIMQHSKNLQYSNLSWTGGYRINEFLRFGLGLGVRYYLNNSELRHSDNKFEIPIFANVRGNFISADDRDGVPFWSLNVGGITHDGLFASPTVGYSFGGVRNNFQVGLSYTIGGFKNCNSKHVTYSYLGVKLGYEF